MLNKYRELTQSDALIEMHQATVSPDPIWVGGVGGSGTRLISTLLREMGYSLGDFVTNESLDNLFWPPMRKILLSPASRVNRRDILANNAFSIFEGFMNESKTFKESPEKSWVAKVPSCFLMLEDIAGYFPKMKYVHLIRNGMDMAFSRNLMQVREWGFYFGIEADNIMRPGNGLSKSEILDYWIRANDFAVETATELLGDRFLLLSFDDLCLDPDTNLRILMDFIGRPVEDNEIDELKKSIRIPSSLNRYRNFDCSDLFNEEQLSSVKKYGFSAD
jgi:hypothetical protein